MILKKVSDGFLKKNTKAYKPDKKTGKCVQAGIGPEYKP